MSAVTVSVVTGVYNAESWIRGAVESISRQTFTDLEHIVVDDGSTDATRAILETCQRSNDHLRVFHQANRGAASALNRAIRLSRGRYIAVLDADDLALPRRLGLQVGFLDSHPEHGMVGGQEIAVDPTRGNVWIVRHPRTDAALRRSWVWRQKFTHSAIMVRKRILDRTGLYDETMRVGFDPDLGARIAAHSRVANLGEPVVVRRHHFSSLSRTDRMGRMLTLAKLNLLAVERLSLAKYHYASLILPLVHMLLPYLVIRRLRRSLRQEHSTSMENLRTAMGPEAFQLIRLALDGSHCPGEAHEPPVQLDTDSSRGGRRPAAG